MFLPRIRATRSKTDVFIEGPSINTYRVILSEKVVDDSIW